MTFTKYKEVNTKYTNNVVPYYYDVLHANILALQYLYKQCYKHFNPLLLSHNQ